MMLAIEKQRLEYQAQQNAQQNAQQHEIRLAYQAKQAEIQAQQNAQQHEMQTMKDST
jgi:hypothetical protein